jgi:cytochrome c6
MKLTTPIPFFKSVLILTFILKLLLADSFLFPIKNSYANSNLSSFETGKTIFIANCSVCHLQGKNVIIPEKNLKLDTLQMNGMDNVDAIVYQVTNGKNGMPAFGGRLTEEDIEKVAIYVLKESSNFE